MAYFGRIIALGRTVQDEPAVIYGISGRSEGSKKRKLTLEKYQGRQCVHVREVGELTADQKARPEIFFYPTIVADEESHSAIVTNGDHTKDIVEAYFIEGNEPLAEALRKREHEPDSYSTPRIAGVVGWPTDGELFAEAALLAKEGQTFLTYDSMDLGMFVCISTYQGSDEPSKPERGRIWFQKFESSMPDELASELYNWMDVDKRVAAAAARQEDFHGWQLAVRNLHE